jgi:triphosphatase
MDAAVKFPTSPKPVKAAHVKLSKRMNVEQAFQAIVCNCINQIQDNEAGVSRGQDIEFLHQMRIGLRRLDAAFALFSDLLQPPPGITHELDWLMGQLGPVRDWDVFSASTLPRVAEAMPAQAALDSVREAARAKSEVLHAQASAAVSSVRFARLLSALENWVAQRGWRCDLPAKGKGRLKMRVPDFAAALLEQEQQRLLRRGRKLKDADSNRRHRVRIAAKRTRYAAEFFASLYRAKRVRPYVQALAGVQDALGRLNDASVAARLLDDVGVDDPALPEGAAMVHGFLAAGSAQGVRRVRKRWKQFTPLAPPH